MNVAEICKSHVVTVHSYDELSTATRLMREKHVGYLVVVDPLPLAAKVRPVGVLTDRDIVVSVLAAGLDPRSVKVADIMTRAPVVVTESQSIASALKEMRRIGVRRLPVIGDAGQLVGLLSLDDVVETLVRQLADVAGSIGQELSTEALLRP